MAVVLMMIALPVAAQAKVLTARVNEAFRGVHGRNPVAVENQYWLGRVVRGDKITFEALQGAMYYHKALGKTMGSSKVNGANTTASVSATDKTKLIKDTLIIFVDIYGRDPTNTEKAWWRKRISCGEISSGDALKKSMGWHKGKAIIINTTAINASLFILPTIR